MSLLFCKNLPCADARLFVVMSKATSSVELANVSASRIYRATYVDVDRVSSCGTLGRL